MKDKLREIPFFAFCADEDLDKMLSGSSHRSAYRAGEKVVSQDSPCRSLLLLTSGSLRAESRNADGKVTNVENFVAPFPILPEILFASHGRYPFSIVASGQSEVWHVDREGFFDFMLTHPSVMRIFLQIISDKG